MMGKNLLFNMMLTPSTILASLMMISGTGMALTSSNWFFVWIGLEINMFSFIPLLMNSMMIKKYESASKYLLIQVMASMIMLYSSYMMNMTDELHMKNIYNSMLTFSLLMKLGMFPAYYWFPPVMQSCNWFGGMLLASWQKLAPAFILMTNISLSYNNMLMVFMILTNTTISGIIGSNQSDIKTIMAYSSINHMGWFLIPFMYNMPNQSMYYLIMYLMMSVPIFIVMMTYSCENPNNSNNLTEVDPSLKISLLLMFLSLAGMPPLSGFTPKLMVLMILVKTNIMFAVIMMIITCLSLYFYLRLAMNLLYSSIKMMTFNKLNSYMVTSIIVSLMLTPFLIYF
uniref:NADH dehydrogenase subunit 2 n=1 Tax=Glossiphonia complanata TaxID=60927 RepID=UPI0022DCDBD2|nr:NADH dehydrogenase subunit 2 [Glossiphonia complanata]UZT67719.1 NADH dehydrogenase subunit 2 [Glossiphonia complanata]